MSTNYRDNSLENDLRQTNCQRTNQSCTDLPHLIILAVFFAIWTWIAIHAYSAGAPFDYASSYFRERTCHDYSCHEISFPWYYQCSNLSASFIWLAMLFMGFFFMAIRFYTKQIIYAVLFFTLVGLCILSYFLIFIAYFYALIPILIISSLYGLTIHTLKQVGISTVCSIIQDACKAMINLPSTVIITIFQINTMILVTFFTISVISNLASIETKLKSSETNAIGDVDPVIRVDSPAYVIVYAIIFAIFSVWMITLAYNFGRTALYGTFVEWHRAVDKNSIPRTLIVNSIFINFRYHLGTVAFGSTIFTVVQILRATFDHWSDLLGKFKERPLTIFCFLNLLANGTTNALILCASHGTSFYRSTKDSFELIMRNPLAFAATRIVTEWMMAFGVVVIPGLTLVCAGLYFLAYSTYYLPWVPGLSIIIIGLASLWLTLVFLITLRAAIATCLFRYLQHCNSITADKNLLDRNIMEDNVPRV